MKNFQPSINNENEHSVSPLSFFALIMLVPVLFIVTDRIIIE